MRISDVCSRRTLFFCATVSFYLLAPPSIEGGTILLDDVMDRDTQKKTGVSNLTYQQKRALERWINTTFVLKNAKEKKVNTAELSLSQNIENGHKLELTDGSIWEVAPGDVSTASFWLIPFPLQIIANEDTSDNASYPKKIVNVATNIGVKVRMIQPPIPPP